VEKRFRTVLGFGASPHFYYFPLKFDEAVNELAFQYFGLPTGVGTGGHKPYFGVDSCAPERYSDAPLPLSSQVR